MNKEEILKKSREENNNKDIAGLKTTHNAAFWAYIIGIVLCCILVILDVIFTGSVNFTICIILFGMLSTVFMVKYIKIRRKHELFISLLYAACFVLFFVMYILKLCEAA